MFCKYCGKPTETEICPECAAQQAQAQQAPVYAPAKPAAPAGLQGYVHYIAVAVAALALIFGLLTMFGAMKVNVNYSLGSYSDTKSMSVSDVSEMYDSANESFFMGILGNILFGVAFLGVAAIGALYFLKVFKNMPYYDQYITKFTSKLPGGPLFAMGVLGAAGCVLQFLLYMFCTLKESNGLITAKLSCAVNGCTWVLLVVSAVLIVLDKFVLNKKEN